MVVVKTSKQRNFWFERLMAIIATINLGLILFDLSYVTWRDFYVRKFPQITQVYDSVKGIEPHRETQKYLNTVQDLEEQVSLTGLKSPEAKAKLDQLVELSAEIINTNPFAGAGKSGALEKIKNRMREHMKQDSAKGAFSSFWNQEYLAQYGWTPEMNFFHQKIQPLIVINYYRKIGENGAFLDNFWIIDSPFVLLFTLELLGRVFYIKRQNPTLSWLEALLWRWYDLFLLLPFWRWSRIIPVLIRLDQSRLLDFQLVRRQLHRGILANFADEITEIVVVRVINQVQGSVKRGDLSRLLSPPDQLHPYVDINNINELEAIASLVIQTLVKEVLPKIQPEIIALLQHNIESGLHQVPMYRQLASFPGLGTAQNQLSEQLATQITMNLYNVLSNVTKDPVTAKLSSQLAEKFSTVIIAEMQQKHVVGEIQNLLSELLEEIKINYIHRLSQEDINQIIQQTREMRNQTSVQSLVERNRQ